MYIKIMGENKDILICVVDDNVLMLKLYKLMLNRLKYTDVIVYENATKFLIDVDKLKIDVLFIDINMNDVSGYDVIDELYIKNIADEFLIVAISGHDSETVMSKIDKKYLNNKIIYLQKPIRKNDILNVLKNI